MQKHRLAGSPGGRRTLRVLARPGRLLSTIVMGNTLVNVAAGAISASVTRTLLPGPVGFGAGVVAMTFLLLVLGEISPKILGRYHRERWAVRVSGVMGVLTAAAIPVTALLEKLSFRNAPGGGMERGDIITLVELARGDGVVGGEALVAGSLLTLGDRRCQNVMVPRSEVRGMRVEWSLERMREEARNSPHMKFPLVDGPREEMLGVLHARDLLGAGRRVVRKALFLPETAPLDEALTLLRRNRGTLGVVVDEHGDWSGILSESDILAKAVFAALGGMLPPGVTRRRDGYLIPAGLPLETLSRIVGEAPRSRWAESCGGFVEELTGRVPGPGECFRAGGLEFRVESSDGRSLGHLLVRRVEP